MMKIGGAMMVLGMVLAAFGAHAQDAGKGHIYEAGVAVHEDLRASNVARNFDGLTLETDSRGNPVMRKEIFTGAEINALLDSMAHMLQAATAIGTVTTEHAVKSPGAKKALGGIGKGIVNEGMLDQNATYFTMEYFPGLPWKKALESAADVYYEIDVKVNWGGNAGRKVVMNEVKAEAWVKYAVEVTITALDAGKKELWKKKHTASDFSPVVEGAVDKKFFQITGTEKVPLETITKSILIAFHQTLTAQ